MKNNWTSIKTLPHNNMRVEWFCENDIKDVGYYSKAKEMFITSYTQSTEPVTYWRPLIKELK